MGGLSWIIQQAQCNHKCPDKGETEGDLTTQQGCQSDKTLAAIAGFEDAATKNQKRQGNRFAPGFSKKNTALLTPSFYPNDIMLD